MSDDTRKQPEGDDEATRVVGERGPEPAPSADDPGPTRRIASDDAATRRSGADPEGAESAGAAETVALGVRPEEAAETVALGGDAPETRVIETPADDAPETRVMETPADDAPETRVMETPADDAPETRVMETPLGSDPAAPPARSTVYGSDPTPSELVEADRFRAELRQLATGTVLFGEYEIVDVLGAGGMGEVYRARHRRLDETRAIKVMHPNMAGDSTAAEFFDREAKALLSVRHDAVVHCHDLLSDAEGRVYLVMEMVDGISLADRLRSREPLSVEEVRTMARRIGAGLAAAHRRGVIHRDLSPDNILLPGGRPEDAKLIDFGIAKVLAAGQETILEGFKGKLAYASPEQLGFFEGRIDGRSDIYSLGLVLYAAATGTPLDMGTSVVEAVDARRRLAQLSDACPAELRADLEALLALHPDDRPENLDGRFSDSSTAAVLPEPTGDTLSWLRLGGGGLALAALAAAAVFALRSDAPLEAEPVAVVGIGETRGPEIPTATAAALEPAEAVVPAAPRPDRVASATERLRIMGLLRGAQNALERDMLTSPAGESAYDKFRQVLALDPRNSEARSGVQKVAARYVVLARGAITSGELERADEYLGKAREVSPRHPDLAAARAELSEARAGG